MDENVKASIDELAMRFSGNVPRFLQALEQQRYVILDRDHLPRLQPSALQLRAAARQIALEERRAEEEQRAQHERELAERYPVSGLRAGELLVDRFARALRIHHDDLAVGEDCARCGLIKDPLGH